MCGIFAVIGNGMEKENENGNENGNENEKEMERAFESIRHRGPDDSQLKKIRDHRIGFHRLAINDLSEKGNQPLRLGSLHLICNGEIYNHQDLVDFYHFDTASHSDCEVILHMYARFGIERTLRELDGYFAFVLIDEATDCVIVARDPIGVRALYMGQKGSQMYFASEAKALHDLVDTLQQFPPSFYWVSTSETNVRTSELIRYTNVSESNCILDTFTTALEQTRTLLSSAVKKRVQNTDRPFGCLLSGGLDSSLITALVCTYSDQPVVTFSIGLEGSVDLFYAKLVADYLGTVHHEVIVTEHDMISAIPNVIRQIESYDTTTVRASTPMYLLAKYISEHTDIKVLFSGEGSDELSGSYLYFKNAPNVVEFQKEILRLTTDLCYFDVLRADKCIAGHGLELRVPFLDKEFVDYYLHINPLYKCYNSFQCEKYLLRKCFVGWLPDEVLWRKKEAFSDGVSTYERSWYQVIAEHVATLDLSDIPECTYLPSLSNESKWYRSLFDDVYPNRERLVPYYWLPRWCGTVTDPSARVLSVYS
jgi:asparagine synthase (glutamine-hydrolysing)